MHADRCIRSDGDWFCAPGCTHYHDEKGAELNAAACAVADAWATTTPDGYGRRTSPDLESKLNRLEEITRHNPARKVSK